MEQAEDGQGAGEFGHGVGLSADGQVLTLTKTTWELSDETFRVYDWDIPTQSWVFRGEGQFDEKNGVV